MNTVVYDDEGRPLRASNTDVAGLLVAWRRAAFFLEQKTVAIIGAGGAARAVVVAAAAAGAARVIVHARRPEAAAALVGLAATQKLDASTAGVVPDRADVVVVAASGLDEPAAWLARSLRPAGVVHDLRYGPRARPVRDAALRGGARFADGTTMLLGQAEAAAALFLGEELDAARRTAMRQAMAGWLQRAAG